MPTEERIALRFEGALEADELQEGQIIVVDGHVAETTPDPDDPSRIRIVIDRLLAGVEDADRREVVLIVPGDMRIATARLVEGESTPPLHAP